MKYYALIFLAFLASPVQAQEPGLIAPLKLFKQYCVETGLKYDAIKALAKKNGGVPVKPEDIYGYPSPETVQAFPILKKHAWKIQEGGDSYLISYFRSEADYGKMNQCHVVQDHISAETILANLDALNKQYPLELRVKMPQQVGYNVAFAKHIGGLDIQFDKLTQGWVNIHTIRTEISPNYKP